MTHIMMLRCQTASYWKSITAKSHSITQKTGYDYPTVWLPHTFTKLAGLSTRIYQTIHDGALAFLVVVSQSGAPDNNELKENAAESSEKRVDTL